MDNEVEFLDMIRQSGCEPAVAFVRVADGTADEKIAGQLQIPEGTPVIRVTRLCTADGRPAIYCEDVVEKALAKGDYTIQDFKLPIFHFLQRFCGIYPYLDLTDVRPPRPTPPWRRCSRCPWHAPAEHGRGGLRHRRPSGVLFQRIFRGRDLPPHGHAEKAVREERFQ